MISSRLHACALAFLLLASANVASAQRNQDVISLDHADSLIGREIDGEKVRELIGNVRFSQGSILVNCRRAIQFMTRNRIELEGEVAVRDDSLTLFANRGIYYSDTKLAEAFDRVRMNDGRTYIEAGYGRYSTETQLAYFRYNVRVEDTSNTLAADELSYFRKEQRLIADGNVVLTSPSSSVIIRGGHFENDKVSGYSAMTVSPQAVQIDTAGDGVIDSLVIKAGMMESYEDSVRSLVAVDSVVILRSDFSGECGRAMFFTQLDSLEMRQDPFLWASPADGDTTQVSGDSIFIRLRERVIDRLVVRGTALAISQADSSRRDRFHQMSGDELVMMFRERRISRVDVDRTASMVYFLFEDGLPNGLNRTSGDHVAMVFDAQNITSITVSGGVEGTYVPERLLMNRESDYNLQGFNWRADRPRRQH